MTKGALRKVFYTAVAVPLLALTSQCSSLNQTQRLPVTYGTPAKTEQMRRLRAMTERLPRMPEVLKRKGFDPRMVERLSPGVPIFYRGGDAVAKKHFKLMHKDMGEAGEYSFMRAIGGYKEGVPGAFAIPNHMLKKHFKKDLGGCLVTNGGSVAQMNPRDVFSVFVSRHMDKNKRRLRKDFALTSRQLEHLFLAHETRHCSLEQKQMTPMEREADAVYHALQEVTRSMGEKEKKEFVEMMFHFRAIQTFVFYPANKQNLALLLDAKLKGERPPSREEIEAANVEAYQCLSGERRHLSTSLGRKRLQIYFDAVNYLAEGEVHDDTLKIRQCLLTPMKPSS